jgi:hypothetical protein
VHPSHAIDDEIVITSGKQSTSLTDIACFGETENPITTGDL